MSCMKFIVRKASLCVCSTGGNEGSSELSFVLSCNSAPLCLELEIMLGQGPEEGIWRKSAKWTSAKHCARQWHWFRNSDQRSKLQPHCRKDYCLTVPWGTKGLNLRICQQSAIGREKWERLGETLVCSTACRQSTRETSQGASSWGGGCLETGCASAYPSSGCEWTTLIPALFDEVVIFQRRVFGNKKSWLLPYKSQFWGHFILKHQKKSWLNVEVYSLDCEFVREASNSSASFAVMQWKLGAF